MARSLLWAKQCLKDISKGKESSTPARKALREFRFDKLRTVGCNETLQIREKARCCDAKRIIAWTPGRGPGLFRRRSHDRHPRRERGARVPLSSRRSLAGHARQPPEHGPGPVPGKASEPGPSPQAPPLADRQRHLFHPGPG